MKVLYQSKNERTVEFGKVKPGQVFRDKYGCILIKTNVAISNAVTLESGITFTYSDSEQVVLLDAEVIINK